MIRRQRAAIVHLAATVATGGGLFIVAGIAQQHTAPPAPPARTIRPATVEEERQRELDRLAEAMNEQRERGASTSASTSPSGPVVSHR